MSQTLLFSDPQPLVQRLGKKFFRQIPRHAGVYKMRDAQGNIIYVGKAKNLRQRLRSYRIASPERLGRRHLRLLEQVARIEFELCPNETQALKHEAKLIRTLKPRFNRAGVWPGKPQFLAWRFGENVIEFSVQETPLPGWQRFGPIGAYAPRLRAVLVRLLWLATKPGAGFQQFPHGWSQGRLAHIAEIDCAEQIERVQTLLENLFWVSPVLGLNWLALQLNGERPAFERTIIARDIGELQEFFAQLDQPGRRTGQMALL